MIDRRERVYQAFKAFLSEFVRSLNDRSEEGWAVLVEGQRDSRALRKLGYRGQMVTVSLLGRSGPWALKGSTKVIILTDLDSEGARLASKYTKKLGREGVATSLSERKRLETASRGVFLHIENLERFVKADDIGWNEASGGLYGLGETRSRSGGDNG
ncbi:MAG: hypothetical protein JRN21_08120 [Nitrososphaerota archaeon]|nr:hypothetical protein [Nitrososphaerota archaeon]